FLAVAAGCERTSKFDGPTVNKFVGKLVQDGQPVSFSGDAAELKVFHEKGQSFNIPLKPDGTFNIGWMPIGKYSATVIQQSSEGGKKGGPKMHSVPGGLTIEDGKTEYAIELGKGYKP
ncbi:MAG: hypothetical protein ACRC33_24440, partial [Gemmataceae bacterium]